MPSVQEILSQRIPDPTLSFVPSKQAPLPSEFTFSRSGPAYTWGAKGTVEKITEGPRQAYDPRTGQHLGLAAQRYETTNVIADSASISKDSGNWVASSLSEQDANVKSVIEGQSAHLQENTSAGANIKQTAGNFNTSGNNEFVVVIAEQNTADVVKIVVDEITDGGNNLCVLKYNFSTDSLTGQNSFYAERLQEQGPNGRQVVALWGQYDPANVGGTDYSGNSRRLILFPDNEDTGSGTIFHHAQLTVRKVSAPIITEDTSTHPTETLNLNVEDSWFNEEEGTFLVEFSRLTDRSALQVLDGRDFDTRLLLVDGNGSVAMRTKGGSFGDKLELSSSLNARPREIVKACVSLNREGDVVLAAEGEAVSDSGRDTSSYLGGGYSTIPVLRDGLRPGSLKSLKYYPRKISKQQALNLVS